MEYSSRPNELQALIRVPEERDLAFTRERGAEQAQVLARYTSFMPGLAKYGEWRERALSEALDLLKEQSSSLTGANQQTKWLEYFSRQSQEAMKQIVDMTKAIDDVIKFAPGLYNFAVEVANQEAHFFSQLGRAPLAYFGGQVQAYAAEFRIEAKHLEDKWKALGDQDRPIDQKAAETSEQILKLFQATVDKVIAEQRGLIGKAEGFRFKPGEAVSGSVLNALSTIGKLAANAVFQELEQLKVTSNSYADTLMDLYQREETLLIMFEQIRLGVYEFLKKTNLSTATEDFAQAKRNAFEMADGCISSAQKDDAKRFVEKAVSMVEPFMLAFKVAYDDFVDENRDIFVGPIDSKTIDQLLEVSERNQAWEKIEHFDLPGKLQSLVNERAPTIFVDVDGLSDQDKEDIQKIWKVEMDRLAAGLVAAKEDKIQDRLKALFKDKLASLIDRVKGSKGGLQ